MGTSVSIAGSEGVAGDAPASWVVRLTVVAEVELGEGGQWADRLAVLLHDARNSLGLLEQLELVDQGDGYEPGWSEGGDEAWAWVEIAVGSGSDALALLAVIDHAQDRLAGGSVRVKVVDR